MAKSKNRCILYVGFFKIILADSEWKGLMKEDVPTNRRSSEALQNPKRSFATEAQSYTKSRSYNQNLHFWDFTVIL